MKMLTIFLYSVAFISLCISFVKDRERSIHALQKAWKAFENILPQFLGIIVLVSISLSYLKPNVIGAIIGAQSGWLGALLASIVGAVTLIPGFVAFPTAALLLQNGAGMMQIGAFVSSLMMVGIVTFPVEVKYFGRRVAVLRNALAFTASFFIAWVIKEVHSL